MVAVAAPAFDTDALRGWADHRDLPPLDDRELRVLWAQLVDDLLAAASWIEAAQQTYREETL